jgi:hypothetical protein
MYPDPAPKRYIARRRLRVGEAFIDYGEEFPAGEVTHSLLAIGWVEEDVHGELGADRAPAPVTPKEALLEERDEAPTPRRRRSRGGTDDA